MENYTKDEKLATNEIRIEPDTPVLTCIRDIKGNYIEIQKNPEKMGNLRHFVVKGKDGVKHALVGDDGIFNPIYDSVKNYNYFVLAKIGSRSVLFNSSEKFFEFSNGTIEGYDNKYIVIKNQNTFLLIDYKGNILINKNGNENIKIITFSTKNSSIKYFLVFDSNKKNISIFNSKLELLYISYNETFNFLVKEWNLRQIDSNNDICLILTQDTTNKDLYGILSFVVSNGKCYKTPNPELKSPSWYYYYFNLDQNLKEINCFDEFIFEHFSDKKNISQRFHFLNYECS